MSSDTRRDWEYELREDDTVPSFEKLETFIQKRVWALRATEATSFDKDGTASRKAQEKPMTSRSHSRLLTTFSPSGLCGVCGGAHYIGHCSDFKNMDPPQRRRTITQLKLRFNCMRSDHVVRNCPSSVKCHNCKSSHHTLLHQATNSKRSSSGSQPGPRQKRRFERNNHRFRTTSIHLHHHDSRCLALLK